MTESPDTLRRTIASTQEDLSRNLEALESKGQDLVDWRAHFEKRPLAMLGAALVGGAVAAAVLSGGRSAHRRADHAPADQAPHRSAPHRESSDTWRRLRSGIGVAAAGVAMEAISKALPGIKEHLIEPVRSALRPEEKLPFPDRRFNGMGISRPQGNGFQG